jgi:AraC family transcriptional regulator, regulatory protein of adaptative response / methylated-DNA-[protein]-cysteine methyltransferase
MNQEIYSAILDTPLGNMIAIADEKNLYLLEFIDCRGLEREIAKLRIHTKATIVPGITKPITSIKAELASYFNGTLKKFITPFHILGTPFQQSVWRALQDIPYGQTRSYADQAHSISNKSACRAVANANGANQIAIVIPCHRIINSNGNLGGYGGGIDRKRWLLDFESKHYEK